MSQIYFVRKGLYQICCEKIGGINGNGQVTSSYPPSEPPVNRPNHKFHPLSQSIGYVKEHPNNSLLIY